MKKFLLYVVVIVALLFLGFTVYYLVKNDEKISLAIDEAETIYLNEEESYALPLKWTKPSRGTKITVDGADGSIVSYDANTKMFTAKDGGVANITVKTSNSHFGPYHFSIAVCDGEANSPYVLRTAEELAQIGKDIKKTSSKYYVLGGDIDLSTYNNGFWVPLGEFNGHFDGNGHTLYNLKVNSGTYAGLFETVTKNGVVENVKFARVDLNGEYSYAGAVAGRNSGTIGKVDVTGSLTNTNSQGISGFIAGINEWNSAPAFINMCSARGILVVAGYAGGLVGYNSASVIVNSRAILTSAQQTSDNNCIGGLVGWNRANYDDEHSYYYPSAIVKSYAIIDSATGYVGAVIGADYENNSGNTELWYNKFSGIYYATSDTNMDAVASGMDRINTTQVGNINNVTKDLLLEQETYVDYDFDNVWLKEATDYATLNYNGAYENVFIAGLKKEVTPYNINELIDIINAIKNTDNDTVIKIDQDLVWDLNGSEWSTIAPNKANPFRASIIVSEGKTLTIKNFKITGENSSFFGYIGGSAKVDGIVFENVTVDNTVKTDASVVASGLTDTATLENISVKELVSFKTKAVNIGLICAETTGTTIKSCVVSNEEIKTVTIYASTDKLISFGAIVGKNQGLVKGCVVENIKLDTNTSITRNGRFDIGAIAGSTGGNIANCEVKSFNFVSVNEAEMNVGGIVGRTFGLDTTISKSYSKANLNVSSFNEDANIGGIVGYLSNNSLVTVCAYVDGTLRGANVAGLVAINYGEVFASFANGALRGINVSGLAVKNYSLISNCYTLSRLVGENKQSVVSGLAKFIAEDSIIDHCFSASKFEGSGKKYAETESPFRLNVVYTFFVNLVRNDFNYGDINNCVIINYGDAEIQKAGATNIFGKGGWIDANEAQCMGEDNYAIFTEKAGFDGSIWNFEGANTYPTLKDAVVIPVE